MTAMSLDLNLIRQRHDLMVQVGTLELALDAIQQRKAEDERARLIPQIQARMQRLNDTLAQLPA
ncbi:MAG: hypothetical protein ACYCZI_12880 [Metallibacterium scheffleri]|jgi:hypothetical protein|uniref:Uncharacterized protein n=1 Tax=Metallibacterium scheffleri TaxID=993689 RepID=A0A4S3KSG4_9GAMM|nr:hypothetical protein [Metallibacterium scheffleri]THD11980.1 hypothetical protein B1806_01215 [Metallibacterium scheffleri]